MERTFKEVVVSLNAFRVHLLSCECSLSYRWSCKKIVLGKSLERCVENEMADGKRLGNCQRI